MKNKEIEELLNELKRRNERYNYCKNNDISFSDEDYKSYLLLSYIEQLEKKVDQYENPDDLTLFYMWLDEKAKDKMKQLENNRDKAIRTLETLKGSARWERHLYEVDYILDILKGDSDE